MNKPTGWRVAVTLAVLLGSTGAYWWRGHEALKKSPTAPPNPTTTEVLRNGLKLGLDLKGGIHLVMQVKTSDALRVEAQDTLERLRDEGTKRGVAVIPAGPADGTGFSLKLDEKTDQAKLKDLVTAVLPPNSWSVDQRGREWKIGFKDVEKATIEDLATRQAVETIRTRVDALGVAEPVIQRQGTDRIVVEIPGVDDPSRVKEIIGTTGLLELTLVDDRGGPYPTPEGAKAAYGGAIPEDLRMVEGYSEDADARTRTPVTYVLKRAAAVTGRDLKNARVDRDKFNQPAVMFFLTAPGAVKFAKVTGENINKHLAIVLDNRVVSAPNINSQIKESGIIEGNFTAEKADALALVLRSGALPAEMIVLEERTVGPSLGLDSIKKGVLASVVGMLCVFVVVVFYYRLAGVNAVLALVLNAVILLGALAYINATLTLPGIAGFILTIGMAVDSNVLIFERIREEMDNGKAPKNAIDLGFKRAWGTIVDTHVTTISAALFLFQFGTGPVKGFAVTLVIGLLASVFTAVFVSHLLFDLIYGPKERVETVSI